MLRAHGNCYKKEFLEIKSLFTEGNLLEFQEKNLNKLLLHAYNNVPYYHRVFKENSIVDNGIVDLSNFNNMPLLNKETIGKEELISKDHTMRKWYYNYSGGSTGEPTKFIQDDQYTRWIEATNKYYYQEMLGIDGKIVKKIILWGSPRDLFKGTIGLKAKINSWITNTILLNSFKMTKKDMEKYIKIINSYKPDLIRGYAGSLYGLCNYIEETNSSIYSPKIVVSSAETLGEKMREQIESVFGTKLHDFYGSRETASIAGECKYGLMHMFMFNNYVEILDDQDHPVEGGETGKVIVTNLHNYSMPFIRYEIGDAAIPEPKKCQCGNMLPTLKKVAGRVEEQFVREDGSIVIGYFFVHLIAVTCKGEQINKFQVIQEDYNKIRILIVSKEGMNGQRKKHIEEKIKVVMGKNCNVVWDFVDDIPKTKSGKYLYTKCLIRR